ncbi:hypothetical protein PENTCL1PPCAC_25679, partial [Pristionchus entomophagus]
LSLLFTRSIIQCRLSPHLLKHSSTHSIMSKELSSSKHGLLCAALLGLGQLCMYTGFDSQSFIVESVMHSVAQRSPEKMNAHSGYRG